MFVKSFLQLFIWVTLFGFSQESGNRLATPFVYPYYTHNARKVIFSEIISENQIPPPLCM